MSTQKIVGKSLRSAGTSEALHYIADPIARLYKSPLTSTRTGPLYNAFSYPTKISPEAIAVYIATHTDPGATIVDTFAGSGSTGIATLLCDRPTQGMLKLAASLGVDPKWGKRKSHLFEIGVLGSFVSQTLCNPPEPHAFAKAVDEFYSRAKQKIGYLYETKDDNGRVGELRHAIWSDVLICPFCKTEVSLWDATVSTKPLLMADTFRCDRCDNLVSVNKCERAAEYTTDVFGNKQFAKKRVLARVHGQSGSRKWQRPPIEEDYNLLERIEGISPPDSAPMVDIEWGELHRAGYHLGIDKLHHFYTKRNFIVIARLMDIASEFPSEMRDALRLLVLSYNSSHSTLMTRVVMKKGQSDFVLTGSQSGVLYISGLPVEKNILEGIKRKSKSFIDSFKLIYGSGSEVTVHNMSSETMPLAKRSVDYIFTDPPFGDYIPYAELNQINELWLGRITDRSREAIVSPSQSKGIVEYGAMMETIFQEMARVIKPNALATIVFHSAHSDVWRALVNAYTSAGFTVEATSVLDKIQASFKQVVSTVAVKGDPLILLSTRKVKRALPPSILKIINDVVLASSKEDKFDCQRLYSQFIGKCLELGCDIDMDAKTFYELIRDKVSSESTSIPG